jgi:hypothetical protein
VQDPVPLRISKGQGYQGFISSFSQKRANLKFKTNFKMRKTDRISLLLGSIKCFPISFNIHKDTLDGALMELVSPKNHLF